jgi:hypothetical protein
VVGLKLIVNVQQAKDLLTVNREKHIEEYKLQLEAWKVEYEKWSNDLKAWSQAAGEGGEFVKRPNEPHKPGYHVHSYDKLLRKLGVHVETNVEIDAAGSYGNNEYEQIFENKFDWSGSFRGLTASYINNGSLTADKITASSLNWSDLTE